MLRLNGLQAELQALKVLPAEQLLQAGHLALLAERTDQLAERVKQAQNRLQEQDLHYLPAQSLQLELQIGTKVAVRVKGQSNRVMADLEHLVQKQKVRNVNSNFWYLCA